MLLIEHHRDFVVQSDTPNRKLMDAIKFYSDIHPPPRMNCNFFFSKPFVQCCDQVDLSNT